MPRHHSHCAFTVVPGRRRSPRALPYEGWPTRRPCQTRRKSAPSLGSASTPSILSAARRGPWKGLEDVEFATLEWVAWYNGSRLLEPLGYVPPAEFDTAYHDRQAAPVGMAVLT